MQKQSNIRVRIAPSPTGLVHIGTLRTILYNWLFAKHLNGKFIIRIEDTDQTRFVPGALENLLRVMRWADFDYDEGPYLTVDNKIKERGDFGPYVQSKRIEIYQNYIQDLLDKGKAYYCFCSKERLDEVREGQTKEKLAPKYDGFCRKLTRKQAEERKKRGEKYVIRFKMPANKKVVCKDLIHGQIVVNSKDLDDFVLIKADCFPTYHFANIVDDHLMKITHVLRGDEWIASFPKHLLLYEAFGWNPPEFAHLPVILNKSKKKLSKRHDSVAVQDFIDKGYLRDAVINFITLLGWNSGSEQELYTRSELIKQFSLDNVHKAPAVFDQDKLDWINGEYIRKLSEDQLLELCVPFLEKTGLIKKGKNNTWLIAETEESVSAEYVKRSVAIEQARIKTLTDITIAANFFFQEPKYDPMLLIWKNSSAKTIKENLQKLVNFLDKIKISDFMEKEIEQQTLHWISGHGLTNGQVLWPMRAALSGKDKSPGPFEIAAILGKKKTIQRLQKAIELL
ncbi:glutamate--tRNA ligase [Candidatus Falkowbacteria bacterium]|nr:glutamate--tRNA ligase [Candidatus Falkowbacteria bacterium]